MSPIQIQEATKLLFKKLPSRRMRDILEKRFGLKGGRKHTLEAIGREYKITRERVRQIEADALKYFRKDGVLSEHKNAFKDIEEILQKNGGVMAEDDLVVNLAGAKGRQQAIFLLTVANNVYDFPETEEFCKRWASDKNAASATEKAVSALVEEVKKRKVLLTEENLYGEFALVAKDIFGFEPDRQRLSACLKTSRLIRKNPYGEYGLASWPSINPRGVKDKAYAVLEKENKPLHFRDVTKTIDRAGWVKKRAHPQTVHNELIKDPRFVLVGRGMYALKDWGYEPGVVRDVVCAVLRGAGKPLTKEEIISLVGEKRIVKPQTVLLNLQNRSVFKRDEGGKFTLV